MTRRGTAPRQRRPRPSGLWLLVCLLLTCCSVLSCANATPERGPLWADPGEVRLSVERTRVDIEIHNHSGTTRPLQDIALGGEDWDTLRFVDATLPRTIPARDSVVIPLEVSAAAYRVEPGRYRSGRAALSFSSSAYTYELPIEFVGTQQDRGRAGPLVCLLLIVLIGAGLSRRDASPARPDSAPLPSSPSLKVRPSLELSVAFAAFGLALASLPFGLGLCQGRLGLPVGPRELAQCRAGLGGAPLQLFDAGPGLLWLLSAIALGACFTAIHVGRTRGARAAAPALARAGLRLLIFVVLVTTLGFGLGLEDSAASTAVLHQAGYDSFVRLPLPRWGLVAQPLGFVIALLTLTFARSSAAPASALPRAERSLVKFEELVWATLIATYYLGGPLLPGLSARPRPLLAHGAQIGIELLTLTLEVALLLVLARRLRAALPTKQEVSARVLSRVLAPLALVQLVAVLLWRLLP